MDRDDFLDEIAERMAILTLTEEDLHFDFVLAQLTGLKEELRAYSTVADASDRALLDWLEAEYVRGMVLYSAAQANLRTQRLRGASAPYDPATRSGITSQFTAWAGRVSARLDELRRGDDERDRDRDDLW
jgi:hypothetical protein